MKTIFVTIARGSLIRNFFHTGIVTGLLKCGFRVVVLAEYISPEIRKKYAHKNLVFEPLQVEQPIRFRKILLELRRGAVFNETVHTRYRFRISKERTPNKFYYIPRRIFLAQLRFIPGIKLFIRFLDRILNPQRLHDNLFLKYKPDLVFNTASGADGGVLKSARRYGVTSVDMPKSWDNLSKELFNVKADYLFVWSPFMRKQALIYQGYKEHEILMVGVPQFDFYKKEEYRLTREEFCRKLGLDPKKKIIFYGSAGSDVCDDPAYILLLKKYIEEGDLPDTQVLVRPHLGYKDDRARFSKFIGGGDIVLDESAKQDHRFKDHWDTSEEHIVILANTLLHSDVSINMASTLTLDATACGVPVINMYFDPVVATSIHTSAERLYFDDYIQEVTKTGGVWLPKSKEEFLKMLQKILIQGEIKKEGMEKIINHFIYKVDGRSAERVIHNLEKIMYDK